MDYCNPAEAARHLQMLLDEKFEHDNTTRWVLAAASRAARERARKTDDLDDAEIVALIEAVEHRNEDTACERASVEAVNKLCAMLGLATEVNA